jgi:arylsulfatase
LMFSGTALPKEFVGQIDKRPAEVLDIYPTILTAIGINTPNAVPGINLFSNETRDANFCALHEREGEASFMWRTEEHKLILRMKREYNLTQYDSSDIIGGEFYELLKDPQEWNNLYGLEDVKLYQARMTDELIEHIKKLDQLEPNSI